MYRIYAEGSYRITLRAIIELRRGLLSNYAEGSLFYSASEA